MLILALARMASAAAGPIEELRLGETIRREIAGGGTHSYTVKLSKGQYALVSVYQRSVDLVVAVFGNDGQKLFEIDSPNAAWGPEQVSLLAESTDTYRVDVSPLFKTAAAGPYEIRLEELRLGSAQDRETVLAQKLCAEGADLENVGTAESRRRAIAKYEKAFALRDATGNRRQAALTLTSIGELYGWLGERKSELGFLRRALPLMESVGDAGEIGLSCYYVSLAYHYVGESEKALQFSTRALSLCRKVGYRNGEAYVLNMLGVTYASLGEHRKALTCYSDGLPLAREAGDPMNQANILTHMGQSYLALGEGRKALEYMNEALPLRRVHGDRRYEATTLSAIGEGYQGLGEHERSLDYYGQALALERLVGDQSEEAATLNRIGSVYASFGERQKALDHYNLALAIRRQVADHAGEADSLYQIARVERDRGELIKARKDIEAAFDIFDSIRSRVGSRELRAAYSATVRGSYDVYIDLLVQLHEREPGEDYDSLAFGVSESARARGLLEILTEAQPDVRLGVGADLLERERTLRDVLNGKMEAQIRLLSGKHTEEAAGAAAREIEDLKARYEQAGAEIRAQSPRYAALMNPRPLLLTEVQKKIVDRESLLLEYALGEDRSYVFAVTPDSIKVRELPKRMEVEAATRRAYDSLTARSRSVKFESAEGRKARIVRADAEYLKAGASLSQMLLGPIAEELGSKRLLIVLEGALQYLPFASLPSPVNQVSGIPLGAEHEIVILPSASVLAVLRQETKGRVPPPKTLAVLGDPVFDRDDERLRGNGKPLSDREAKVTALSDSPLVRSAQDLGFEEGGQLRIPRLPFTRREAEAIFLLSPEARRKKFLDFDANRAAATSEELGQYRFVHFATHGFLNSIHPELSGLVFSLVDRTGNSQDGFLPALEVYNLKLPVDLVVLSGCRTGLGKDVRGEGLVGLTRGFMYAGAARVLVSLWDVDDEATAELMVRFYEGMLGKQHLGPAAALRAAQLTISKEKRWQAPYYWAAFILQGEPR